MDWKFISGLEQECRGAGTQGHTIPVPFSCFALK